MGATSIEWTDRSLNPLRARAPNGRSGHHCVKVSPGCKNCYSSRFQPRLGLPVFQEQRRDPPTLFLDAKTLLEPLTRRKPTKFFWCDMTDMFGEWVPFEWIAACFAIMAATPRHTHQVLTKRPDRALEFFAWIKRHSDEYGEGYESVEHVLAAAYAQETGDGSEADHDTTLDRILDTIRVGYSFPHRADMPWPLPNVWLGVSMEDQKRADERIPLLLKCPAAVRFLSCEPLLGPVDLTGWGTDAPTLDVSAAPETWADFAWPDWVPKEQRKLIEDFWSASYSRGPREWLRDHILQHVPATGAHRVWAIDEHGWATVDKTATNGVIGRYLHLWNNIGRIVTDNGETIGASGGHGSGWFDHWPTSRGGYASRIHWVITGSESGPGARPMSLEWVSSLVTQCEKAGVAAFVKQIANEHDRKGGNPEHWPAGNWPRQFPRVA
jgi:protein gp37